MKLPAWSRASSSLSTRRRSSTLPPQARSRKAARSAGSVVSSASRKIVRSDAFTARSPFSEPDSIRPIPAMVPSSMRRPGRTHAKKLSGEILERSFGLDLTTEPGTGIGPEAVGRAGRDAQDLGGLGDRESGEIAELDQLGGGGIDRSEPVEGCVDGEQLVDGPIRARAARRA